MAEAYPALFARTQAERQALAPGEALVELETALTSPEAAHAIATVPLSPADSIGRTRGAGQEALLRALRDRLERLGYLTPRQLRTLRQTPLRDWLDHVVLRGAIRLFQREAGIVEDAWFGPQTWTYLQALYSFEGARSELGRRAPMVTGPLRDAERRAALLRLDALGLVDDKVGAAPLDALTGERLGFRLRHRAGDRWVVKPLRGRQEDVRAHLDSLLERPLQRLRRALGELGIADLSAAEDAALLRLVIHYDPFVDRLSALSDDRGAALAGGSVAEALMGRVLIIEMWLLDQPVTLKTGADWRAKRGHRNALTRAIDSVLTTLRETEDPAPDARTRPATRISALRTEDVGRVAAAPVANFPIVLAAVQVVIARSVDDAAVNEALVETTLAEARGDRGEALQAALAEETEKRRSRLFDGIRRAIGWLAGLVRKVFDSIVALARRIVRVVFAFSAEALAAVRDAVFVVETGIGLLTASRTTGPSGRLTLVRGSGFDFLAFAAAEDGEGLVEDARFFVLASRALQRASALIASLVSAIRRIARAMAGGWILVGLGLLRVSRQARRYARWLGDVRELAAAIRALTVANSDDLSDAST